MKKKHFLKYYFLSLCTFFIGLTALTQEKSAQLIRMESEQASIDLIDRVPIYKGCEEETSNKDLQKCMDEKMHEEVVSNFDIGLVEKLALKGVVRMEALFIIDEHGKTGEIKVKAPKKELVAEAKRVIKLFPKMKPGVHNNEKIRVQYFLPITFKVEDAEYALIGEEDQEIIKIINFVMQNREPLPDDLKRKYWSIVDHNGGEPMNIEELEQKLYYLTSIQKNQQYTEHFYRDALQSFREKKMYKSEKRKELEYLIEAEELKNNEKFIENISQHKPVEEEHGEKKKYTEKELKEELNFYKEKYKLIISNIEELKKR